MNQFLTHPAELLILIFLIITFLQSAIDKVIDWKGNLGWLTGHFEGTPLARMVPALLMVVLITEMAAGIFCALGIYQLVMYGETAMAFYGALLSCVALLMLLFGQRLAKDYDGAKTIAVYFIPAVFLVYLLHVA